MTAAPIGERAGITILGSGTCVPSLERSACSVLVTWGGTQLLLDSGPGTMRRLLEAGVLVHDVDAVCYSHFHPDHTAELVPFLFANKYPDEGARRKRLALVGGRGFTRFFNDLKSIYGDWMSLGPGLLEVIELTAVDGAAADFSIGPMTIATCSVNHRPESLAFAITLEQGRQVVYSGDTDYSENLVKLSQGADLLICEAATPDEFKVPGHLTPSLAGEIATRAGVQRLVLTHLYPVCDQVDIEKQCRKAYKGPLVVAADLMQLDLKG